MTRTSSQRRSSFDQSILAWSIIAALSAGMVAAKACTATWYRHRCAHLAARGELPSKIVQSVGQGVMGLPWSSVQNQLRLPLPIRDETSHWQIQRGYRRMVAGDQTRAGWEVDIEVDDAGRVCGLGSIVNDYIAAGDAYRWSRGVGSMCKHVGECVCSWSIVCLIGAAVHRPGRKVGGTNALAAALAASGLLHLSEFPDRVLFEWGVEPIHWVPLLLVPVAAVAAVWPTRRRAGGSRCARCGYDLTGNLSGVCPECGTAVVAPSTKPPMSSAGDRG